MRLSHREIQEIKQAFHAYDPTAVIYLFGSRVDDNKRGGDIDLLIYSTQLSRQDLRNIKIKLYDAIGEQKIDFVLASKNNQAFVNVIKDEAVKL